MNLGEGAGGIKCVTSRGSGIGRHMGTTNPGIFSNMGTSWAFDAKNNVYLPHLLVWYVSHSALTGPTLGNFERSAVKHMEFAGIIHNIVCIYILSSAILIT